jgi:hypothetical protein
LEVVMSFTRWFVSATFTGGLIALSLQGGGIAQSAPSSIHLIADAGSSSKMQLDKDGSGITDPQSNKIGVPLGTSSQRPDSDMPKTPGSKLTEKSSISGEGSDKPGATAAEGTSANPCENRGGQSIVGAQQEPGNTGYTIRGEVLRVEGNTYVVRRQDGKEVSLQTDQTNIAQGDYIQANMNGQNQVLWIGPLKSTDRRNEHEPDCR